MIDKCNFCGEEKKEDVVLVKASETLFICVMCIKKAKTLVEYEPLKDQKIIEINHDLGEK